MPDWALWLVAAAILVVGEILTTGLFFLGPVALAALVGALVAAVGAGVPVQLAASLPLERARYDARTAER